MTTTHPPQRLLRRYGDWAVVTGASEGIGRAFAREIAADGMNLVLVARRGHALNALATALHTDHRVQCKVLVMDLADESANAQLLQATRDLPVGLLVAAAGHGTSGPLLSASVGEEVNMLDVNCRSTLLLAHGFGGRFVANKRGGLILMSSLLAFQGVPRAAHYAATKAYVQTLAEGIYSEFRAHGVDVIASAPGPVNSGFAARANMKMGFALDPTTVARATLAALGRKPTVRAGWLSWALESSLAPLPRRIRTMILAQVMAGMTSHQSG